MKKNDNKSMGKRPDNSRGTAAASEPEPGIVITCEHGGNRIPSRYRGLFTFHQALLQTHRGYDPGALLMAQDLAKAFAAPMVSSTVSRLLVDLNRSVGNPAQFFEATAREPAALRQQILQMHYAPYRAKAEHLARQAVARHGRVVHISSHSFTPELDGEVRQADIGLLYDPTRPGEVELCARWKAALKAHACDLVVRRNYPYQGKGDGLASWFRRQLTPDAYIGVELEINQKHVFAGGPPWTALRKLIVASLRNALQGRTRLF
ncbi:MAG: N-formylglutamate amidohydrolase [Rhodocyclales bacterium]|nr:N-formylglutamate amidohydrolase [Rhodocyclales bacterium]